ncbi:peptide-N(4)-(N-acetyl-beta-glucosaminyl)asparagine amidase [Aplysia californica]|uniref:Peptide-N(4)-(N-acetyl-beta-glucosaminyl)asparagine amidase n=1 Tax=Aplysia californica TaxID=6500 RepID=A0ABM0JFY2_APLCA|nr:peptide-N(4)-(N-acetyl-beta-glucosaminyl)asparagine amidase [Aplysia californica]
MASSTVDYAVKELAEENSVTEFLTAADILLKFASNVLEHPLESKYRRIRIANQNVQNKLLNVTGGIECLFAMGFQEADDGECLLLPQNASLQQVGKIKADLLTERNRVSGTSQTASPPAPPPSSISAASPAVAESRASSSAAISSPAQQNFNMFAASERDFLNRIMGAMSRVQNYEVQSSQERARAVIPIERLESEAKAKLASLQQEGSNPGLNVDLQDCLVLALLRWFKQEFFHWVDTVPCELCGGQTRNTGSLTPVESDLRFGASRVEAHTCDSCSHVSRFPRYTNAVRLLETRRGRCGEWADCFTLCCRALGFEARYVLDWTDHVWTEVFSVAQKRWLHCDPCENVCDKPLLYESGWGKKLSYVLAFSKDDLQDVSWRYSGKHSELLSRRKACRESWLQRTVHGLWKKKLATLPEARQSELRLRLLQELVEFLTVKTGSGEVLPGRTTGSLAWREARGEVGDGAAAAAAVASTKDFVFSPTESERESEIIHVCYNCAEDKYVRKSSGNAQQVGWLACVNSSSNVVRKEEHDWKMVYLARQNGGSSAEISWKFDVTDTDLRISKMELKASTAVYENGKISWQICAGDNCFSQNGASLQDFMTFDLHGTKTLTITAVMRGGKGDVAWQHTQLFRQSLQTQGEFPFEVRLFLN